MTFSTDIQMFDVPTNATNGDIIKRMFPDAEYGEPINVQGNVEVVFVDFRGTKTMFRLDWWNAPYFTKERGYER